MIYGKAQSPYSQETLPANLDRVDLCEVSVRLRPFLRGKRKKKNVRDGFIACSVPTFLSMRLYLRVYSTRCTTTHYRIHKLSLFLLWTPIPSHSLCFLAQFSAISRQNDATQTSQGKSATYITPLKLLVHYCIFSAPSFYLHDFVVTSVGGSQTYGRCHWCSNSNGFSPRKNSTESKGPTRSRSQNHVINHFFFSSSWLILWRSVPLFEMGILVLESFIR